MCKLSHCFYRLVFIIALGFVLALSFTIKQASADNEKPLEKVTLQLKWKHQFQFAGFYAALEKGFYQELGLDVTIIEGSPGVDFVEVVVSGKADYGIEMPDLLLRRAEGEPVVALACIYQHSPITLISLSESNIHTPHDLIGRKIMLRSASNADLRAMISHEGIDLGTIEISEHSFNLEDLLQGKTDAMSLYSTAYAAELQSRGIAFNSLSPYFYGVDFYGDCLFTSEDEIKKHPSRVKAFRAASLKGWEYAMDNPEELAQLIHEKYSQKKSIEMLLSEAEQMEPFLLHRFIEIGHINPGRWEHIKNTFVSQGMLEPDYSLKGFIYDPNPKPDYKWVYWTIGIIAAILVIVGVCVAVLFVFNKRLNDLVKERTRELENVQEELIRKERLAVLGQLSATVNHEIRSPLGTLRNAVFSISEAIKHNEMERVGRSLELAERSIKRCDRIINEIMDFTHTHEIKGELTYIDRWLNSVLDEQEIPEDIECVRELNTGIVLPIDREHLRRAVINVVTNAVQALQDKNSRCNQLKVKSAVNGERLELSFIDTGPGIPEEIMEKIFEPLFSTKRVGTGLGMPIIKNIMEKHYGGIEIKSKIGQGTTVTLWLSIPKLEEKG